MFVSPTDERVRGDHRIGELPEGVVEIPELAEVEILHFVVRHATTVDGGFGGGIACP